MKRLFILFLAFTVVSCEETSTDDENIAISVTFDVNESLALSATNSTVKILLPATLKESDYITLQASVVTDDGVTGDDIVSRSSISDDYWDVEISKPTFNADGIYNDDAAVSIMPRHYKKYCVNRDPSRGSRKATPRFCFQI
ncbi:MAG: hypothetical protein R3Y16_08215 [Rikenellaceae bacterium]